jgi:NAD(P)-dependent dehydrogenase (short-subunit alcohol dehydrogenase family)
MTKTDSAQWAFLSNLSSNPDNTVIALVRNKAGTEKRIAEELPGRANIHVLYGDLDNYKSLEAAAADTAKITGGGLDYLIANAAYLTMYDQFDPIGVLYVPSICFFYCAPKSVFVAYPNK